MSPLRAHPQHRLALCPLFVAVAATLAAMPAAAAEQQLRETVVTATLTEHETRTAPASVTTITREELETRNASDLLDALRGTPGITLMPRQVGGRKTIALRGFEGKHTLTLVDGRRISPSDDVVGHSDYQYGWLPVSAIERIEVIRGPMSTLYGSEALGGVVNMILRRPTDAWTGSLEVGGSNNTTGPSGDGARASFFAAGPVGDAVTLRFNGESSRLSPVGQIDDRRYSEIEGRRTDSFGVGGSLRLSAQQYIEADWQTGQDRRWYDDVNATRGRYENTYHIDREQGSIAWKGNFDGWRGQLRAYFSEIDIKNTRTNGVSATRPQNLRDEVVDGFAALRLGRHELTFGGEFREETLENNGLIGGKDDATHKALFVQDEFFLTDTLALTAGVRFDRHEIFGSETSPRAYLVWQPTPELVLKGGYGHAFKAPTLKQASSAYVGAEGPHTFLGNDDIKPESSDTFEISADWQSGPLALRSTLFRSRVEDLITSRVLYIVGTRRTYLYDNINKATLAGLEAGFTWTIVPSLSWHLDLTRLRTKDEATGNDLPNRADLTVASSLDWKPGDGWSARIGAEYNGDTKDSTNASLPSYTLWNASVGKKLNKIFAVRAGVNNLSDVRLAERSPLFGYAEPGRTVYVNLRADF
ncbi:MAG: TonB-dependent receptor [Rhodocyclaceae bacterium]|nr:TonB-dependent receptor [Rhodocyclaceae bacterium]